MFLAIVALVSLDRATLVIDNPSIKMDVPAVIGKPSTATPEGLYLLEKAYSTKLKMNMLVFRREGNAVYAIHPNLPSRAKQIDTPHRELSNGCVGLKQKDFDKLWQVKSPLVLQVF